MKRMPSDIIPMLPSQGNEPFADLHYSFEISLQGIRAIAYIENGTVKLQDQRLRDITGKHPDIVAALQKIKDNAILDGEIVRQDDGSQIYFAYDLLFYRLKDYMAKPLYARKSTLKDILPRSENVLYHGEIVAHGIALYRHAEGLGMAGVIGKRIDSIYLPGSRSKDWIYVPVRVTATVKK